MKEKQKLDKKPKAVDVTKQSRFKSGLFIQIVFLNIVNLAIIGAIGFLYFKLPQKAQELKELHNTSILEREKTDALVLKTEIDKKIDKINELKASQINEKNLVKFFEARDKITSNPIVIRFEISDKTITTKTKKTGYGVTMEAVGNILEIGGVYKSLQQVPFLIHPLTLDIAKQEDGRFVLNYFGILYI